jgi:hypothetical protein
MGRTLSWWHRAVCMPHSSRYRRRAIGKPRRHLRGPPFA